MSLYNRFSERKESNDFQYQVGNSNEAWVALLYACMLADGKVSDVEIDALTTMLVLKERFDGDDIAVYFEKVADAAEMIGPVNLVDVAAPVIETPAKATLFAMAVDVVLADGVLEDDEKLMIAYIAEKLDITQTKVQRIIEVIMIRNAGNKMIV